MLSKYTRVFRLQNKIIKIQKETKWILKKIKITDKKFSTTKKFTI